MTIQEKHELLDMIWETMDNSNYVDDEDDESQEELKILQERLEEYKANPSIGLDWQEAIKKLRSRKDDI